MDMDMEDEEEEEEEYYNADKLAEADHGEHNNAPGGPPIETLIVPACPNYITNPHNTVLSTLKPANPVTMLPTPKLQKHPQTPDVVICVDKPLQWEAKSVAINELGSLDEVNASAKQQEVMHKHIPKSKPSPIESAKNVWESKAIPNVKFQKTSSM